MRNKNEVFEYLIDQLRQQLQVVDVMGEIKRWSIDRSIAGRGNYTDEENAIIDAYIVLEHNPYKQQCEDLAHEVQSLRNQLRDASVQIKELREDNIKKSEHISHLTGQVKDLTKQLAEATGDVEAYKLIREGGHIDGGQRYVVGEHGPEQSGYRRDNTQECYHNWRFVNGKAPAVCINCDVTKYSECEHEWQFYGVGFPCMCKKCGLKK